MVKYGTSIFLKKNQTKIPKYGFLKKPSKRWVLKIPKN
jgi:hypothetical protein